MKQLKSILCLVVGLTSFCVNARVTDPNVHINEYNRLVSSFGESAKAYDYVLAAYQEYNLVLNSSDSSYPDRESAVSGLKWAFPYLMNGAFYYSGQSNQKKALVFAEAYIDTYINPSMRSAGLAVNGLYPTLAYFAASNNYNLKSYDKAIVYLDAYIKSGDTKNLKEAFNYAAKACIYTNRKDEAKQMLISGLNLFPSDLQMLTTIINLLAETKSDDYALQTYVTQALRYKPDEIGLLNIQAQLYERSQDFDNAVIFYKRLQALKPNNLDVARHLGINLYNSGVQIFNSGRGNQASAKFNEAAKVLSDVVISDPLAITYIYALANTYSILGDKDNLERINSRIVALGRAPVSGNATPSLFAINNEHVAPSSIPTVPSVSSAPIAQQTNVPVQPTVPSVSSSPIAQQTNVPVQPAVPSVSSSPIAQQANVPAQVSPEVPSVSISDVDMDIPVTDYRNSNTFAVIVANNKYKKVADVDNAENDGKIFAEYCQKVLGIPERNIRTYYNVTYGELLDAVEDIKLIARAKKGDLDIIFYYAGHGVPDEQTKSAYILPIDADGKQTRLCYPLSELYAELAGMKANNTFVFLDACFSGATRSSSNEMLLSARSVAIDVDPDEVEGKLVIFSAATGDQTALSYAEQNHGMFTYFLLKRLKETKGNIDLGALADYLTENVSLESQLKNRKQQIPTVIAGSEYGITSWKNLRLVR